MPEGRAREFWGHTLPAWISALCAICALVLSAYTVLLVRATNGNVEQIMNHMAPH